MQARFELTLVCKNLENLSSSDEKIYFQFNQGQKLGDISLSLRKYFDDQNRIHSTQRINKLLQIKKKVSDLFGVEFVYSIFL